MHPTLSGILHGYWVQKPDPHVVQQELTKSPPQLRVYLVFMPASMWYYYRNLR